MESSTKKLAESFLLDSQIYGAMVSEKQRQEISKKQAQLLVDTKKAEDELDAMIAGGEK
jgi:hypothetical protein